MNDDAEFAGTNYVLHYNGPNELHGIPHDGEDQDGDMMFDRFFPRINIKDGVALGPTGVEYVIRATEIEQTLIEAPGECLDLELTDVGSLELPDLSDFTPPIIGTRPEVDAPPSVIEGVLQDA